ncbi:response regulator aspartate phosphatase C [Pullulanibacillus pueri]|uniref:Tetratricopeptide repeat protein n=1 Tax=Pullulanibacillus pueri TaxID=1437324 RepID=A0A8J2ZVK8_9BACL|nr:tetratricopeptide repeat protein [Pullulanibacillus pueri]MBM7682447.1 response regulator aspartate phosphatase C [Pullulanibacillus pueri]GGH81603.1 hypothetical protein GCM10007096_19740 [Pullulanibacillus pueri]
MQAANSVSRLTDLLNEFYFNVKVQNLTRATTLYKQLEDSYDEFEANHQLQTQFNVVLFGYALLNVDFEKAQDLLEKIEPVKQLLDDQWCYRFYLFKGLHSIICNSDFNDARTSFEVAEQRLGSIDDEIERAEYDYKMAFMYYHLEDTLHSVQYITKALETFRDKLEYNKKIASCELILGLNSIDMKQYEQAEEQFYRVLDYANQIGDNSLKSNALHNLGLLYASQNKASAAVHWLVKSLSARKEVHYITAYLLSRENYKLGNKEDASEWLQKGIESCNNYGNNEYLVRFKLLEAYYENYGTSNFKTVYEEGIAYFHKEKLWRYVDEYSEQLASYYRQQELYKEAAEYYALASNARNKICQSEGLN